MEQISKGIYRNQFQRRKSGRLKNYLGHAIRDDRKIDGLPVPWEFKSQGIYKINIFNELIRSAVIFYIKLEHKKKDTTHFYENSITRTRKANYTQISAGGV